MVVFQLLHPALLCQTSIHRQGHQMYDFHIFFVSSAPILSKDDCSKASKGSFSLLSPSTPLFRNLTFFPFLRNQMMVVKPGIARKTVGEGSFVKRRDIVSLMSIEADDKDASSLY